jgi:hypothetical protein
MEIDVIILSYTKDLYFYGLLQRTLNTLHWSEKDIKFNVNVVETNEKYLEQGFVSNNVANVITPKEEFNYNRFLNFGLNECKNEWLVVANNDLVFTKGWLSKIFEIKNNNPDFLSFCPFEPNWHCHKSLLNEQNFYEGYRTAYEVTGWCIVMHQSVLKTCNLFDESFAFWYQDNDYAMSLKQHNIRHALVRNSRVYHETSKSHDLLGSKKNILTHEQVNTFNNKWK